MIAFILLLSSIADPVSIQVDRAIFGAFVTIAVFFATHVVVAIRWGGRVSSDVGELVKKVQELSGELHGIRTAVGRLPVTDARLDNLREEVKDLNIRVREWENRCHDCFYMGNKTLG